MKRFSAFTLIEMSMVLILLSLIAGSGLHVLNYHIQHKRIVTTQERLREAKSALLQYAQIHGHLPCPAADMDIHDQRRIGGWEGRLPDGRCKVFDGFLPALTLGLDGIDYQGYAVDGWDRRSNRLRYAIAQRAYSTTGVEGCSVNDGEGVEISEELTNTVEEFPLLKPYWGLPPFNHAYKRFGLCICSEAKCKSAPGVAAAAVIYSLGENGGENNDGINHIDEQENLNHDRFFVSRTPSANFDDYVEWISSDALWGALLEVGALHVPASVSIQTPINTKNN